MSRLAVVVAGALGVLAGCDPSGDGRERSLQFVTENVLQPTCGASECHSSMTRHDGYAFDTVDAARASIITNFLISYTDRKDPDQANLIKYIHGDPGYMRMPQDYPMPDEDVSYLKSWIEGGANGAQCPVVGQKACGGDSLNVVVLCGDDYNFGAVVEDCGATGHSCLNGACT